MPKVVNGHDLETYFSLAFEWLKKTRKHNPPSSHIWDLRRCWHERKESITHLFVAGSYPFNVQKKISLSTGETMALWHPANLIDPVV